MPEVRFAPSGASKTIKAGATILAAANQARLPIGQSCDGEGVCGWCRVRVVEGMENIMPPTVLESNLMHNASFRPDERAACLARVTGDITITTTYW
jgi:adenylate cyclase